MQDFFLAPQTLSNATAHTLARSYRQYPEALTVPRQRHLLMPNHSLQRRANGVQPGPRGRAGYRSPRGPAVTPSSTALLER